MRTVRVCLYLSKNCAAACLNTLHVSQSYNTTKSSTELDSIKLMSSKEESEPDVHSPPNVGDSDESQADDYDDDAEPEVPRSIQAHGMFISQ